MIAASELTPTGQAVVYVVVAVCLAVVAIVAIWQVFKD